MKKEQASGRGKKRAAGARAKRSNEVPKARAKVRSGEPVPSLPAQHEVDREIDRLLREGNAKLLALICRHLYALIHRTLAVASDTQERWDSSTAKVDDLKGRLASLEAAVIDAWNAVSSEPRLGRESLEDALAGLRKRARSGVGHTRRMQDATDAAAGSTEHERDVRDRDLAGALAVLRRRRPDLSESKAAQVVALVYKEEQEKKGSSRVKAGKRKVAKGSESMVKRAIDKSPDSAEAALSAFEATQRAIKSQKRNRRKGAS